MIIQITQSGSVRREVVEQAEFVQNCRYSRCRAEFTTVDPDKVYCVPQHRKYAETLRTTAAVFK